MKAHALKTVPAPASSFTNEELLRHVEHYYPNLRGPLAVMRDRFSRLAGAGATAEQYQDKIEACEQRLKDLQALQYDPVICPHCGSQLHIELEA